MRLSRPRVRPPAARRATDERVMRAYLQGSGAGFLYLDVVAARKVCCPVAPAWPAYVVQTCNFRAFSTNICWCGESREHIIFTIGFHSPPDRTRPPCSPLPF